MSHFALSSNERDQLDRLAASLDTAKALRRAQALLWLDEGESVQAVATRLGVSRRTVYHWVARFEAGAEMELSARLSDGARSGRPPTAQGIIDPLLDEVVDQDPRAWGYHSTVWTAALLRQYLLEVHQIEVSQRSVSLALKRLAWQWKRPCHSLAQRSASWRQAKGGSNAAWRGGSERSC